MQKLLIFLISFICFACGLSCTFGEESNSKTLYEHFRDDPETESYVVVIYEAKIDKSQRKPTIDLKGVIVGVIKGNRPIGQKIEFNRVDENGFNENAMMGELYVVKFTRVRENDATSLVIDSQHPRSFVQCSPELFRMVQSKGMESR